MNEPAKDDVGFGNIDPKNSLLIAGVIHDLKNMLGAAMGNLQLARVLVHGDEEVRRHLGQAEFSLRRSIDMSLQLLELIRGGQLESEMISVGSVIEECVSLALSQDRFHCRVIRNGKIPKIVGNGVKVGRIFSNLLFNAAQAMRDGGEVTVRLTCEGDADEPVLVCEVEDNGPGPPSGWDERIFEDKVSTKSPQGGLGLHVVSRFVEELNGKISLRNNSDGGACFRVEIPTDGSAWEEDSPERIQRTDSPQPSTRKGRVLVVDDEQMVRETLGDMLQFLGFDSDAVGTGEEGLEKFRHALKNRTPYELVITDLSLPGGMSGNEFFEQLKKLDPEVRAIVTSGYANDPAMLRCRSYGFLGRIFKPYSLSDLQTVVDGSMAAAPSKANSE